MIILDTNVVSEAMKQNCNGTVLDWLNRQDIFTLHITSTVLAELLVGIEYLPSGRRKQGLSDSLDKFLARTLQSHVLSFDEAAARKFSPLMNKARSGGRVLTLGDGQIAAVAAVHGFTVATRDVAPFLAAGVPVLNPWQE